MKYKIIVSTLFAVGCLFFGSCDHGNNSMPERPQMMYTVSIIRPDHGTLGAVPSRASQGTEVILLVNPDPGYILKEGALLQNGASLGATRFDMPGRNTFISAEYTPVPAGNRTVTIDPVSHGYMIAVPQYGPPGRDVRITVMPNPGYVLEGGALALSDGRVLSSSSYTFSLGGENIRVRGNFIPESAGTLLDKGKEALSAGDYTNAVRLFEAAYARDKENPEIIFYSSFASLAGIATDTNVRNLVKNRLGLSRYPATLGELTGKEWLTSYGGVYLPGMSGPAGFQNHYLFQNNGGGTSPTLKLFKIMVWVCFIDKNKSGWNDFLDDTLYYVFGDSFEALAKRIESVAPNQRIILDDPDIIKNLGLDSLFDAGDSIGRTELDAVVALLRLCKASLEWLSAYDWETDVNYYPYDLERTFNEIAYEAIHRFEARMVDPHKMDINVLERILPLKNNFLKNRNNGMMPKAKNDFTRAVGILNAAWEYYADTGNAVSRKMRDKMNEYQWIGEGLNKLQSAVEEDKIFYFSPIKPPGNTWPAESEAQYGVNINKLFIPGQFSIDRLLVTETGGRSPKFFGFVNSDEQNGFVITNINQLAQYNAFGFQLNMGPLKEVFVKGFDGYGDNEWLHTLFADSLFNRSNTAGIYAWYHKR
jgi:hypothetical protein